MTDPTNPGDDGLRRLLHDAVSDVHPREALDDIRSRTDKVVPMAGQKKRWFLPTLAVAAVMALVVGGAFWLLDDDQKLAPAGTPSQGTTIQPDQPSESVTGDVKERAVPVYYVGEAARGAKLFREFHRQPVCSGNDCLAAASAQAAVTGDPNDGDYKTMWPSGTRVTSASYDSDVLTIDLSGDVHDRPAGMSDRDAMLALEQLIFSAQAGLGQGRPPVLFLIDGKPTDLILGQPAAEPLAAGNADDLMAPVQVDNPANGATVSRTFTVSGRAATFEANVVWELTEDGKVVDEGHTTAQECCTLSPFSFEVTAPPGHYTLVVHDTDESGEGHPVNEDTKEITVQ